MTITPKQCEFYIWLLREEVPKYFDEEQFPKCAKAIEAVAVLYERYLVDDTLIEEELENASLCAAAMAEGIEIAASAACSAAAAAAAAGANALAAVRSDASARDAASVAAAASAAVEDARRRIDDKLNEFIENEA